ncbi:response regulator [Thalassobaculum sp.]|uniref:response regulator transcription factor n=1 Tax=Thalassobaculum sp. TaxID=2022740 RepID=UPI0032ECD5B1
MSVTAPKKLTRIMDGLLARFDYAGLRVLVVEPDEDSRAALVRALLALGLPRPTEAANAAEAVAQAAELEPEMVLCDTLLEGPDGIDGLELLFRIRSDSTTLPPGIPVVVLAGETGSFGVIEAKRLGVDGFLVKPVPPKRLAARLNALLMRRFPERVTWDA